MITCTKCNGNKPEHEFAVYKVVDGREYRRRECLECTRARSRQWNIDNPDGRQRTYVLRTWGMSLEAYKEMLQDGCEVCGTLEQLTIDHDHACCPGKGSCGDCIRGVLCNRHNLAEGNLQGDPNEAYALAEYMKKHWKGESL